MRSTLPLVHGKITTVKKCQIPSASVANPSARFLKCRASVAHPRTRQPHGHTTTQQGLGCDSRGERRRSLQPHVAAHVLEDYDKVRARHVAPAMSASGPLAPMWMKSYWLVSPTLYLTPATPADLATVSLPWYACTADTGRESRPCPPPWNFTRSRAIALAALTPLREDRGCSCGHRSSASLADAWPRQESITPVSRLGTPRTIPPCHIALSHTM